MSDPLIYHTPHLYRIYMTKGKNGGARGASINLSAVCLNVMFAVNDCEFSSVPVKMQNLRYDFFRFHSLHPVLKATGAQEPERFPIHGSV